MESVVLDLQEHIAKKLNSYVELFGGSSNLFFGDFFAYHIRRIKRDISRLQKELNKFEKKYNLSSQIFYEKFNNNEFGDEKEFLLWAGIFELQTERTFFTKNLIS